MKHEAEIKYWSEHPDGTKVWLKSSKDTEWQITYLPRWGSDAIYIVDDQWSDLRKAQADGKQLQRMDGIGDVGQRLWSDYILAYSDMADTQPKHWRIKPEEPVYEWQVVYFYNGRYHISTDHYKDEEEFRQKMSMQFIELYEPSRRERK